MGDLASGWGSHAPVSPLRRQAIETAVEVLRGGGLVAFPTETVYGLGCDAENRAALRRLYAVKRRPVDHPVIVHVAGAGALDDWSAEVTPDARRLVERCWPGPLTVVVRRSTRVPDEVTGGRDTVGLRAPDHAVALGVLEAFGGGIAAPSANRFGRVSPTTAEHVRADLGHDVDFVLDGGAARVGVESTIVDCSGPEPAILRLGGLGRARIEELVGRPVPLRIAGERAAPGTLPAHYAPRAAVVLSEADDVAEEVASQLAGGVRVGVLAPAAVVLGSTGSGAVRLGAPVDAEEYARTLYSALREGDRLGLATIVVVPPDPSGIGDAVRDRLLRASRGSS